MPGLEDRDNLRILTCHTQSSAKLEDFSSLSFKIPPEWGYNPQLSTVWWQHADSSINQARVCSSTRSLLFFNKRVIRNSPWSPRQGGNVQGVWATCSCNLPGPTQSILYHLASILNYRCTHLMFWLGGPGNIQSMMRSSGYLVTWCTMFRHYRSPLIYDAVMAQEIHHKLKIL